LLRRAEEVTRTKVWTLLQLLIVTPIDENRSATCVETAIYVSPSISDHKTFGQIDFELFGRLGQHPGQRLSAIAGISVGHTGVETGHDSINRELLQKLSMNAFHDFTSHTSATDIRLVGRHYQEKS
jgi:hypothetical protein